jgi:hypothetical protein
MEKNTKILLIATIALIVYIILDLALDNILWNASVNLTLDMQRNKFSGETFMYQFFTMLAFVPGLLGIVAFVLMDCKLNALLYFCVCAFSIGSNELLKSIYHQPRPYMAETSIKAYITGWACYDLDLPATLISANPQATHRTRWLLR